MPIEFPPPLRGNPFDRWIWQWGAKKPPSVVQPPNLARLGAPFKLPYLSPGYPAPIVQAPNTGSLGKPYRYGEYTGAMANPANSPISDDRRYDRVQASVNMILSGISRDGAGAALGNCQVLVFRTDDKSFVGQTTSDGLGNWSLYIAVSGAFFLVEYKAGVPDVAGTSLNNLLPVVG